MTSKSKNNKFVLSNEKKKELIPLIQAYFQEEHGEELGQLAAGFLLDFLSEKIGPEFYNLGISDSYKYMHNSVEDLLSLLKLTDH